MTRHARGTFDVTLKPLDLHREIGGTGGTIGRMSIDKRFKGGIEGFSAGEMLTGIGGSGVKGSAGYVAMERVTGTLDGRRGSFILQHSATMSRGAPRQTVTVVPDSGTEELTGMSGTLTITIVNGRHEYELAYSLGSSAD